MSVGLTCQTLSVGTGDAKLDLILRRVDGSDHIRERAPAVVLLHGGNTNGAAFCHPDGGLAGFLAQEFDVWLLEWRASRDVVDPLLEDGSRLLGGSELAERQLYTLDNVAQVDLPQALASIRDQIGHERHLSLLAHCLSGAAVSMALARGTLRPFGLHAVTLMTLGLFCEVPWNGWLKAENFFLERVANEVPKCRGISPNDFEGWPGPMRAAYDRWPRQWLPGDGGFLDHLSFLIGQPFSVERLHPEFKSLSFDQFFGHLHMGIYMHAAQLVRRGYAAPFNSPDVIDRTRVARRNAGATAGARSDLSADHFRDQRMTLFVAPQNQVWHRDSMDLMYDWMRNNGCRSVVKQVVAGYNLQELLWGKHARDQVYPLIADSLRP